jgi:hypothetical protein
MIVGALGAGLAVAPALSQMRRGGGDFRPPPSFDRGLSDIDRVSPPITDTDRTISTPVETDRERVTIDQPSATVSAPASSSPSAYRAAPAPSAPSVSRPTPVWPSPAGGGPPPPREGGESALDQAQRACEIACAAECRNEGETCKCECEKGCPIPSHEICEPERTGLTERAPNDDIADKLNRLELYRR